MHFIFMVANEFAPELIESLKDVPLASSPISGEQNEFDKVIAKLDNPFIPMVNPDCARSKLDKMCQMKGESIAQYHVRLRLKVAKCSFADPDDAIRSKILQSMSDKKLRREAMVKRYTLQQLLEHAANKEDIDRQAQDMEKVLTSETVPVNRVHERRPQSSKGQRHKKKAPPKQKEENGNMFQYCGFNHEGPRSKCPASGKTCTERSFCQNVQRETERHRQTKGNQVSGKISPARARQLIRL